jgi:hypothetical protein
MPTLSNLGAITLGISNPSRVYPKITKLGIIPLIDEVSPV